MKKYALFDVDSMEISADSRDLKFRPRVEPIIPKLRKMYDFAQTNKLPVVFTTCCSGGMLTQTTDDILHVPLDRKNTEWKKDINKYRHIYLAKKTFGVPEINGAQCAYNVFAFNQNAVDVLKEVDAEEWLVFGNGFDNCIRTTILGMLEAGLNITLIEDVTVRGSFKYIDEDPEVHRMNLLKMFEEKGVHIGKSDEFLKKQF